MNPFSAAAAVFCFGMGLVMLGKGRSGWAIGGFALAAVNVLVGIL